MALPSRRPSFSRIRTVGDREMPKVEFMGGCPVIGYGRPINKSGFSNQGALLCAQRQPLQAGFKEAKRPEHRREVEVKGRSHERESGSVKQPLAFAVRE